MIHGGTGVIMVIDWMVVGQRERLPWHTLWTILAVPAVWLSYVAVYGAVDGRVPYAFLDPSHGLQRPVVTLGLLVYLVYALLRPERF